MSGAQPSVVVCTRNRRAALEECLATLTAQVALPDGLEIVVVDNGSSDGTGEWLSGRWVLSGAGAAGRSLLSSEERDLFARIGGQGSIAYEPAAPVLHRLLPERNMRRWVLRCGWAQGPSNARFRALHGTVDRSELVHVCRDEVRHVVEDCPRLLRAVARRDEPVVLNEVARRSAHLAVALQQVGLYVADRVTAIWDARPQ